MKNLDKQNLQLLCMSDFNDYHRRSTVFKCKLNEEKSSSEQDSMNSSSDLLNMNNKSLATLSMRNKIIPPFNDEKPPKNSSAGVSNLGASLSDLTSKCQEKQIFN